MSRDREGDYLDASFAAFSGGASDPPSIAQPVPSGRTPEPGPEPLHDLPAAAARPSPAEPPAYVAEPMEAPGLWQVRRGDGIVYAGATESEARRWAGVLNADGRPAEPPVADLRERIIDLVLSNAVNKIDGVDPGPWTRTRRVLGHARSELTDPLFRAQLTDWVAALRAPALIASSPEPLRAAVLRAGTRQTEAHGESCDCDTCLVVQPLVDLALKAETPEPQR